MRRIRTLNRLTSLASDIAPGVGAWTYFCCVFLLGMGSVDPKLIESLTPVSTLSELEPERNLMDDEMADCIN